MFHSEVPTLVSKHIREHWPGLQQLHPGPSRRKLHVVYTELVSYALPLLEKTQCRVSAKLEAQESGSLGTDQKGLGLNFGLVLEEVTQLLQASAWGLTVN
jgi:hypothetical protein